MEKTLWGNASTQGGGHTGMAWRPAAVSVIRLRLFKEQGRDCDKWLALERAAKRALHTLSNSFRPGDFFDHHREMNMAWLYLFLAGLFEVGWAIGLKYTEGFSRLFPSLFTIAAMALSLALLGLALRDLPVGTAYAVWTGIGAVGTAVLGIYLFNEPATVLRLACIGLIVAGIGGLRFAV